MRDPVSPAEKAFFAGLIMIITLIVYFLITATPASAQPADDPNCRAPWWPGASGYYCVDRGDNNLVASTWLAPDLTVFIHVCAGGPYLNQEQRLRIVWTRLWEMTEQTKLTNEPIIFTPTEGNLCRNWTQQPPEYAQPAEEWQPDVERWYRTWFPSTVNGGTYGV